MNAEADKRSLFIAGLRDLATYLESHPDVPAPLNLDAMIFPDRDSDSAMYAEIDRIAKIIAAPVTDDGHYRTSRSFGPVTYSVVAILAEARARHDALMSYRNSVIPDTPKTCHTTDQR